MKVLVTRPAVQAAEWVAQLEAQGIAAAALPLIGIQPPQDLGAVTAAWATLATRTLVIFVSPNAADRFFALRPRGLPWPAGVTAASPGPGTTHRLLALGVPPASIVEPAADAPQFDSQALWAQLATRDWHGAQVLIVRGEGGREWLADTLAAQGARVGFVAAYRRAAPVLDEARHMLLHDAIVHPHRHVWFFSSSEAIDHLVALAPAARWHDARALTTHPRIAERARGSGFGTVHTCRPTLDAVVGCIQSIVP
jgi:uroporphyrinogen-III synthase